jgi:signal transduction histidine kinase
MVKTAPGLPAGLCHELRTSLNVITGLAELLLGGKPGRLNIEQRSCLKDIQASGRTQHKND